MNSDDDLNLNLQPSSIISLNGIKLNQQNNDGSNGDTTTTTNNNNRNFTPTAESLRPPNYQMKGKRIKSSPASLLIEKRRLSSQSNSSSDPMSMPMSDHNLNNSNNQNNLQDCFHVTHHGI